MPATDLIRSMHRSLLDEMAEARNKGGRGGRAARNLMELFSPHAAREEQVLLPAVDVLSDAEASGGLPPDDVVEIFAPLLESGISRLEADHARLRRALTGIRRVAELDFDLWLMDIATRTAYHLGIEEERLFPAVVLKAATLAGSLEIASGRAAPAAAPVPGNP